MKKIEYVRGHWRKAPQGERLGNNAIREALAEYAHMAWSGWMRHVFEKGEIKEDGTLVIPAWAVKRWQRQVRTAYKDLPETEKGSDRKEADKMMQIMKEHKGEK